MLSRATSSAGVDRSRDRGEQIFRMGVLVGRHLQRDALVQSVGADPVEVGTGHLKNGDTGIGCPADGFGQTLVGFGAQRHVERRGGNARAQTFDHRVAAEDNLGLVSLPCRRVRFLLAAARLAAG